jgi:hypothetical protein
VELDRRGVGGIEALCRPSPRSVAEKMHLFMMDLYPGWKCIRRQKVLNHISISQAVRSTEHFHLAQTPALGTCTEDGLCWKRSRGPPRALMLIMPSPRTPIRHVPSQGSKGPSSHEHPPENVKPDDDMCTFSREASMQPAFTSSGVVASELNQNLAFHGPIPPK